MINNNKIKYKAILSSCNIIMSSKPSPIGMGSTMEHGSMLDLQSFTLTFDLEHPYSDKYHGNYRQQRDYHNPKGQLASSTST